MYEENLTRFIQIQPAAANRLPPNLAKVITFEKFDSEKWFSEIAGHAQLILVYGVHFDAYEALKKWLSQDPKRIAIFLEDNAHIINNFLHTPQASTLLNDPQVWLFLIDNTRIQDQTLTQLSKTFPFHEITTTAIPSKVKKFPEKWKEVQILGNYLWNSSFDAAQEQKHSFFGLTKNFYKNLFHLPEALDSSSLFGQFKNIPAIICGAGPSLSKNRELLATLKNQALIFGGGTAINALNAGGINPHFSVGVDPNRFFYYRLLANSSWESPFFYYYRMYNQALELVHGQKLLLNLNDQASIPNWFHEALNIKPPLLLKQNFLNVINLATNIAIALGCNPIIFVGIDLAYSENSSYAAGIKIAATHNLHSDFRTKHERENILVKKDIYGQPIKTLWKWVLESLWYGKLPEAHPEVRFINATEGGIGLMNIPNKSLRSVAQKYLKTTYDFDQIIGDALKNSSSYAHVQKSDIIEKLQLFADSLNRCQELIANEQNNSTFESMEFSCIDQLNIEPAFTYFLKPIYVNFKLKHELILRRLEADEKLSIEKNFSKVKQEIHQEIYKQLIRAIHENLHFIEATLNIEEKASIFIPKPENITHEEGLEIKENRDHEGNLISHICFLNGKRHGPTLIYYPNGSLKSLINYDQDRYHGDIKLYYSNGQPMRFSHYNLGKRDGEENIWNSLGNQLIKASYDNDKPIGMALEWHFNGQLARIYEYDDNSNLVKKELWDSKGLSQIPGSYIDSYLESVQSQFQILQKALDTLLEHIKTHGSPEDQKLMGECYQKLQKLTELFKLTEALQSSDTGEPLWKTSKFIQDVDATINHLTGTLPLIIANIQSNLKRPPP